MFGVLGCTRGDVLHYLKWCAAVLAALQTSGYMNGCTDNLSFGKGNYQRPRPACGAGVLELSRCGCVELIQLPFDG